MEDSGGAASVTAATVIRFTVSHLLISSKTHTLTHIILPSSLTVSLLLLYPSVAEHTLI